METSKISFDQLPHVATDNTHRAEVKRNWQESAIVYIAIVGRPGDCLSA